MTVLSRNAPRRRRRASALAGWHLLSVALVLGIWQASSAIADSPSTAPSPWLVLETFAEQIADGTLVRHFAASTLRVVVGFSLALASAVPAGFLMGWYRAARGLLEPWVQFLRTIPPIALIFLVIPLIGIDEDARIFVIWLASFLTLVVAVFQGVRNVDPTLVKAARVLGANDLDIFLDVVVPATLPYTFVGMRIGLGAAWSTLVAAELIGAESGLAYLTQEASTYVRLPTVIVAIVTIGITGLAMDRALLLIERRATRWQERVDR